jgi:hypothetical protein
LFSTGEDSLVVLYRSSPKYDWEILTDVTQNFQGPITDKKGAFIINHLAKGEYTFGIWDHNRVDSIFPPQNDYLPYPAVADDLQQSIAFEHFSKSLQMNRSPSTSMRLPL